MANKVNTTYSANLGTSNVKVQPTQAITPTKIDTSYQGNSNALYGGHDATWWQNQYARQSDAESQAMVRKAADYYGYKIPETVAQPKTTAQTLNSSNAAVASYADYNSNVKTVAATNNTPAQATTYATNTNQEQVAAATPTSQTTQTETVDSYEEFLRKRAEGYQETLDKTNQAIEENKQTAIDQAELQRLEAQRQAEVAREREIADSRSSYEQNKATYGTNAEQMADMGLAGSGYSDYINSQAYATQRAEQQNANANAETTKQNAQYAADQAKLAAEQQANSDKLNAELNYAENMANNDAALAQYKQQKEEEAKAKKEQEEAERKAYYSELLGYANNGSYTQEQLAQLGAQYGLSEEQLKSLDDAALTYKDNTYKQNYASALDNISQYGSELDTSYLDNLLEMDMITQEQYNNLKGKLADQIKKDIQEDLSSTDSTAESIQATIDNVEKYFSEGKISTEQRQAIYKDYVSNSVSGVLNKDYGSDSVGKLKDCVSARSEINDLYSQGKLSKSDYDALIKNLDSQSSNSASGGWYVQGLGSGRENDDIDITIGSTKRKGNGKEYDLLCGGTVNDSALIEELNRIATGDKNTSPAREGGWTWLHGDEAVSNKQAGKLIVAYGNMYIYTSKGWVTVKNDNNNHDLQNAIRAYLGK